MCIRDRLYTVLLAAGLTFSGCSDQFLQDMNPYDSYSPEKTFGIESNLDLYIQNVYYNYFYKSGMTPPQSYGLSGSWNDYSTYTEEKWGCLLYTSLSPGCDGRKHHIENAGRGTLAGV